MTDSQEALPLDAPTAAPTPWSGRLSDLLSVLTAEARFDEPGSWKFRLLKHGAMVALQLGVRDGRRLVRIARAEKPANERAWERWGAELQTFERHLGILGWQQSNEADAAGVAVRYLELWQGEIAPGKAACGRCGKEIAFDLVWGSKQRCENCARLDGDDETREILARKAQA